MASVSELTNFMNKGIAFGHKIAVCLLVKAKQPEQTERQDSVVEIIVMFNKLIDAAKEFYDTFLMSIDDRRKVCAAFLKRLARLMRRVSGDKDALIPGLLDVTSSRQGLRRGIAIMQGWTAGNMDFLNLFQRDVSIALVSINESREHNNQYRLSDFPAQVEEVPRIPRTNKRPRAAQSTNAPEAPAPVVALPEEPLVTLSGEPTVPSYKQMEDAGNAWCVGKSTVDVFNSESGTTSKKKRVAVDDLAHRMRCNLDCDVTVEKHHNKLCVMVRPVMRIPATLDYDAETDAMHASVPVEKLNSLLVVLSQFCNNAVSKT